MNAFRHIFERGTGDRLWVLFHGTGGTESDLVPIAKRIDPDGSLLGIRGKVLENGMPRFFRRMAEGVFDVDDIRRQAADLSDFLTERIAVLGWKPEQVVSLGYSNGANMISAINFLHPGLFGASVLMRPMVPLAPERNGGLESTRVLILDGGRDPLSPPGEPDRLVEAYLAMGADVTRKTIEAGHNLIQADLQAVTVWL